MRGLGQVALWARLLEAGAAKILWGCCHALKYVTYLR